MKKSALISMALVAAAAVIGIAVWRLGAENPAAQAPQGVSDAARTKNYFEDFREKREKTRDQEMAYYDGVINDPSADSKTVKDAQDAKLRLIAFMEHEFIIEELLVAKGYPDAAVTIGQGGLNVVVFSENETLTGEQAAVILEAAVREAGVRPGDVYIITSK